MAILKIRDAEGNIKEILALKGDTGETGPAGPPGDTGEVGPVGPKGEDGYTPVKGVDYFTEEDLLEISANDLHSVRIPAFEEIDNTPFKNMIKACAGTWFAAAESSKVSYGSLSINDTDNMATRVNPMLYATRNSNQEFTTTYRDIWSEAKAGGAMSVNCITLANMLLMGISFEQSRLNGHENVVGGMGYAFDLCKYVEPTKENNTIFYNPNKKLDITTFERILTQASFTETCDALGLVRSVKSSETATDGEIWYDAIKPGDVLFNSSHTMFCLDVETTSTEIKIHYIDAGSANTPAIAYHTITITDGVSSASKPLVRVIRPYYAYTSPNLPNLLDFSHKKFMGLDGPYPGIAKNEDLNTYLTPGEFRCASDSNAASLSNKPADLTKAFKLVVENLLDDSTASTSIKYRYLRQIITDVYGNVYSRTIKCDKSYSEILLANEWQDGKGEPGNSIAITNIVQSEEDGGENLVTFSDGTELKVYNGNTGVGIKSITQGSQTDTDNGMNTLHILMTDGTSTRFTVHNGSKGETGAQGDKGEDGYTPVRGVDYWTNADKAEIETYIDDSVADLNTVLQNILDAIQTTNSASETVDEIEQLLVSYFETRTAEEVEA